MRELRHFSEYKNPIVVSHSYTKKALILECTTFPRYFAYTVEFGALTIFSFEQDSTRDCLDNIQWNPG